MGVWTGGWGSVRRSETACRVRNGGVASKIYYVDFYRLTFFRFISCDLILNATIEEV